MNIDVFGMYIDANGNTCHVDSPGVPVIYSSCPTDEIVTVTHSSGSGLFSNGLFGCLLGDGLFGGGMMMGTGSDSMSSCAFDF